MLWEGKWTRTSWTCVEILSSTDNIEQFHLGQWQGYFLERGKTSEFAPEVFPALSCREAKPLTR